MNLICEVTIKNFRSIVSQTFMTLSMNIFVGLNDAGKSNFLKALNLFFNNETDNGRKFDFDVDYSNLAPQRTKRAKEIIIQIKFEIPTNYTDAGFIIWTKTWRADGLYSDKKNREFAKYSKAATLLNRIRYKYVPAVKGDDYFRQLLGSLYSSISVKADSEFIKLTEQYSTGLKEYTQRISDIVEKSIGINSILVMPRNQSDIFSQLSFLTQDNSLNEILLDQRGDGIKARHIPAILKFIAEQNNKSVARGSVPYTTIWGYEEPENGMEMSRCFDLSRELSNYSEDIQLFITTHSPAFYSMKDKNVRIIHICKDKTNDATIIHEKNDPQSLHSAIGILPLITPFIAQLENQLKSVNSLLNDNFLSDIPTICVEGFTDREVLRLAIKVHSPELFDLIREGRIRILTRDEGCGTTQLRNWAEAWNLVGFKNKLYILFDKDKAGKRAKDEIDKFNSAIIKSQYYKPSDEIIEAEKSMISKGDFLFEMEHLFSTEFWNLMKQKELVEERSTQELFEMYQANMTTDRTLNTVISELVPNDVIRNTIVKLNPHSDKKAAIVRLCQEEFDAGNTAIFNGYKRTVYDLARTFKDCFYDKESNRYEQPQSLVC